MKRFEIAVCLITLIASLILHFFFYYPTRVLFFHFAIIVALGISLFLFYRDVRHIKNKKLRIFFVHLFCTLFLFSLSIFYLITIGSNFFWGKGIELRLAINYLPSINELIRTLPVQGWIIYSFIIIFLLALSLVYSIVSPSTQYRKPNILKQDVLLSGLLIIIPLIFYKPLIQFKRYIHSQGEPLTEFIFPKMFHSDKEMVEFGQTLLEKRKEDQVCIEEVKKEGVIGLNKSVVLIILDALRNDFISAYDYQRKNSPFLDSMLKAGEIIRVNHAFSLSTSTVAGVANIFTSKEFKDFNYSGLNLMKFMKIKNYNTYAFLTGQHLNWYGLANIYRNDCDFFYESKTSVFSPSDNDLVTLRKFESTNLDHPFFAYIHLLSTHTSGIKNKEFNKYLPNKIGLNVNKREALINNYNNGILQADFVLQQIFHKLKNNNQLRNTIIFITSDHGNLFGEDGRWEHAGSVHPYIQSVPLFIYDANLDWYKNTYSTTSLDIAPTIVDRLSYKIPKCWQGTSMHLPLKNYEVNASSSNKTEFPFGIIKNTDSTIIFDELNNQKQVKRTFQIKGNTTTWETVQ